MYLLQLFDAAETERPIDARLLREEVITLGRDPRCDWPISDPSNAISREHCQISTSLDGLIVRAVGANGVFDHATGQRLPDHLDMPLAIPTTLRMGNFRLQATMAEFNDSPMDPSQTMVLTPPLGKSKTIPSNWVDGDAQQSHPTATLLDAFCRGAGLDASLLSSDDPEVILETAGAVYRQMVLGISDLVNERDTARGRYDLARTTIGGRDNNPFKWAPSQRLAIDLLASPGGFLSGPAAITQSLEDIKRHLLASFSGFQAALRMAVESFSEEAIDAAANPRSFSLKSRPALQIEAVRAIHNDLEEQLRGVSGHLDRAFVAAYRTSEQSE